jgi:hypothetical protein
MVGGWAGGWVGGWVGGWSPKEVCPGGPGAAPPGAGRSPKEVCQGGVWMGCYMKTGLLC